MKALRTVSTRRLLAAIVGLAVVVVSGTAIAIAATSGPGPKPRPKPLANAIHDALAARAPQGITADITFTNHLIDSSDIQGADPLLSGATGRLWISEPGHLRLELQSDSGDAQVLVNGDSIWVSDPSAHIVYRGTLPKDTHRATGRAHDQIPTLARIQDAINHLMKHVNVSGATPVDVANQPAYSVRISPQHDGGLLGSAELAWDAFHGVPLRFAIYARNASAPVIELTAKDISYGPVDPSVFKISPPAGSKVVTVAGGHTSGALTHVTSTATGKGKGKHRRDLTTGVSAVAAKLPFTLDAPASLVGLPRRSVTLLDWGKKPAALVTYGQNLGGVAVIEQPASSASPLGSANGTDHRSGLNLPTVSIGGVTGQELDTALGTLVRFTRGNVAFTVVGSVPAAAADAAARAL